MNDFLLNKKLTEISLLYLNMDFKSNRFSFDQNNI